MDCQYHKIPNVAFSAGEQQIFKSVTTVSGKLSDHYDKQSYFICMWKKMLISKLFAILPEYLELSIFLVSDIQQFWNYKYLYI